MPKMAIFIMVCISEPARLLITMQVRVPQGCHAAARAFLKASICACLALDTLRNTGLEELMEGG